MVNQVKAWGTKPSVLKSQDYGSRVAEEGELNFRLCFGFPKQSFLVDIFPTRGELVEVYRECEDAFDETYGVAR